MNTELIIKDLNSSMDNFIEHFNSRNSDSNQSHESYTRFKKELNSTILRILDQQKLIFNNADESKRFLEHLRPSIDNLLNKFLQKQ
jgi:hypothetical protein